MARICEQIYNPDTDENEEFCYEDGANDSSLVDPITYDPSTSDADLAGGLLPPDALGTLLGKDNIDYDAWMKESMTPEAQAAISRLLKSGASSSLIGKALNAFKTPSGAYDWAKIATAGAGLYSMLAPKTDQGYTKPVPKLDAVREQIQYNDPNRVAGSAGRQYFTDPRYVKEGDAASLAAAQAANAAQSQGILGAYKPAAAPAANPYAGKMAMKYNPTPVTGAKTGATDTATTPAGIAAIPTQEQLMDPKYKIGMASGGIASGRYLQGGTDGMADKIPSTIDGEQPAALSHGEFVIPADVVSHLGNGNSEAGADKLYQMMARIRKARTGNEKQGKRINPDKFMPGGLAAAYASGGHVQGYDAGGVVGSTPTSGATGTSAGGVPLDKTSTSNLAPWAGDYVTNFLAQGAALAKQPYQAYTGPLTAGPSDLQQQGFAGISEVAAAGYDPTTFTSGTFNTQAANQYMNPYLMSSLQPQIDEARRQSQITQQQNAGKMTQAGAFGGSRQALMDTETQRALGANLANITGTGYNTAYDKAMAQFNAEQNRGLDVQQATEKSRQYSADFGLKSLNDLMAAGQTQRGITGEGIAADKKQFEEQQAYPFNMVEFQRKLIEGIPVGSTTTGVNQDALSKLQSDTSGLLSAYQALSKLIPKS